MFDAPQLSDGFANAPAAWVDAAPAPLAPGASPRRIDREAFLRHKRLGQAGLWTMVGGVALTATGVVGVLPCATTASEGVCAGAFAAIGVGGLAVVVGEAMLFVGAISAANDLELGAGVGWAGVGLTAASVGTSVLLPVVSGPLWLAGFVCGVVQLGIVGRHGRDLDLVVTPTPRGAAIAGRW